MRYRVEYNSVVKKFLQKHLIVADIFIEKMKILKTWSTVGLDIDRLSWKWKNHFRLRIWKYRFLYEIIEDRILIYFYEAKSRGEVYKKKK